jgi:hydroxymethylbilane synthase
VSTVRIATRASQLALIQAQWVATALERAHPGLETELVRITTTGDVDRQSPVAALTEVGAFVRAVQFAVLDGRADIAVHSCKDLPVAGPNGLGAVFPERESPLDVLVGSTLDDLAAGARVGTGSPRRSSQLALLRPDLEIAEIRGNVDTRIDKVRSGEYAATVLAEAGLARLSRLDEIAQRFTVEEMVPAPAQGALAVEAIHHGEWWFELLEIDHANTRAAVEIERKLLERTGAGCRSALGVVAGVTQGEMSANAFVDDGQGARRATAAGTDATAIVDCLISELGFEG